MADRDRALLGAEGITCLQTAGSEILRTVVVHGPDQITGIAAGKICCLEGGNLSGRGRRRSRHPEIDVPDIDSRRVSPGGRGIELAAPITPLQVLAGAAQAA